MPTNQKVSIEHFHLTQQLGFKPILYCWCGSSFDFNKRYKSRKTAKNWMGEHEFCEAPDVVSHKPKVY